MLLNRTSCLDTDDFPDCHRVRQLNFAGSRVSRARGGQRANDEIKDERDNDLDADAVTDDGDQNDN